MPIDFPSSPTNGQTHVVGSFTWQYDGEKWIAANGIALDGLTDVTVPSPASGNFLKWNGSAWVNDAVDLGTDTTGNYMSDLTQGTGVTITHTQGEGSNATIAIGQSVATSASVTFASVTAPLVGNVTGNVTGTSGSTTGNAATATTLQNARTISLSGDVSGSVSFNGSANVDISATVQPDSVALGTDTTGNYMSDLTQGTGVTITHAPGEGSNATIAIGQAVGTSASVSFAQLSTSGDLTVGGNLTVNGTTTTLNTETLSIEDNIIVLNSNVSASPSLNAGIEIERGTSTNVALRWNEADDKWQFTNDGSTYVDFGAGGATVSETAPASPAAGQVWFESDTAQTFVYYDSQWIEIGASGMAAIVSDSAPSSPIPGQMWFNSLNGGTYIYYSSAWTEVGAVPVNALLNTINAKGDLLVGNADNSVARLGVGADGTVLKANSATATGLEWAADDSGMTPFSDQFFIGAQLWS